MIAGRRSRVAAALAWPPIFYAMPAWTGSLAHLYRHSAAPQEA
jgi:hypothetical protein